ncbi:MAG TPA: hypothetical protein VGX16_01455 [Solirubrobacteraceae bacterium]|jgi:hypothetical protein|nr:hypothetical protein [Solirubrobacteraceae bacterium]
MQTLRESTATVWTATGRERPVFLDEHGRRRRWVTLAGALAGSAASLWLAGLVAGAIGFSTLPVAQVGATGAGSIAAVGAGSVFSDPAHARVARARRFFNETREVALRASGTSLHTRRLVASHDSSTQLRQAVLVARAAQSVGAAARRTVTE